MPVDQETPAERAVATLAAAEPPVSVQLPGAAVPRRHGGNGRVDDDLPLLTWHESCPPRRAASGARPVRAGPAGPAGPASSPVSRAGSAAWRGRLRRARPSGLAADHLEAVAAHLAYLHQTARRRVARLRRRAVSSPLGEQAPGATGKGGPEPGHHRMRPHRRRRAGGQRARDLPGAPDGRYGLRPAGEQPRAGQPRARKPGPSTPSGALAASGPARRPQARSTAAMPIAAPEGGGAAGTASSSAIARSPAMTAAAATRRRERRCLTLSMIPPPTGARVRLRAMFAAATACSLMP